MRVSYLALSEKRCTVQTAGCNFQCRGCFSKERNAGGVDITKERLAGYIPADKEIMFAGGEPTIDRKGLLSIIKELDREKVILSTNGFLLDQELLEGLSGVRVHIDLKALDKGIHRWYTGKDNRTVLLAIRLLFDYDFDFEVSTVYIPEVVQEKEIENIALFLSGIGEIKYKIMRYVPVRNFSRRPELREIENAVKSSKKYLRNVTSSVENRSHPRDRKYIEIT